MKHTHHLRCAAAVLVCSAPLAGTAAVVVPGVASAQAAARSCGAKSVKVKDGTAKAVSVPVSRIRVEGGATCAEAVKVISGALAKDPPQGWVVSSANFKVPAGLNAMQAVNGHKKVKYATIGA
jgi:hypothetical protein